MLNELAEIVEEAEVERFRVMIDARTRHADLWPLVKQVGSAKALSVQIGVSPGTLHGWVNLENVPNVGNPIIAAAIERLHLISGKTFEEMWPGALRRAILEGRASQRREVLIDTAMRGLAERARERLFLPDPSEVAIEKEARELVASTNILDKALTFREREVIRLRFGIGYDSSYTFAEVGRILRVTSERVRQLESKAMLKIKSAAKKIPAIQEYADG